MRKTVYLTGDEFSKIMESSNESFTKRLMHLALLGLEAEKSRELKVTFKSALGYFNRMFKKNYPNEALPTE